MQAIKMPVEAPTRCEFGGTGLDILYVTSSIFGPDQEFLRDQPFPPNASGLVDMIGNVWEWTSDFDADGSALVAAKRCCIPANPRDSSEAGSVDPASGFQRKVLEGGHTFASPITVGAIVPQRATRRRSIPRPAISVFAA